MIICPKCGITNDKIQFVNAFCINCTKETVNVTCQNKFEYEKCKFCDNIHFRGKWVRWDTKTEHEMEKSILSKCKYKDGIIRGTYDRSHSLAVLYLNVAKEQVRVERKIEVDIKTSICVDCSRMSGGYFEAIIQLRGNKDKIEKNLKRLQVLLGKQVVKIDQLKEGIDLYVMSTRDTGAALSKARLPFNTSKSLYGEKQGKRIYRTTFAVRFADPQKKEVPEEVIRAEDEDNESEEDGS